MISEKIFQRSAQIGFARGLIKFPPLKPVELIDKPALQRERQRRCMEKLRARRSAAGQCHRCGHPLGSTGGAPVGQVGPTEKGKFFSCPECLEKDRHRKNKTGRQRPDKRRIFATETPSTPSTATEF